jgi:ribose/xylose/arabinose/galactoside ABC-type transport system permease subunit
MARTVLRSYGILVALAVMIVIIQWQNDRFLTETNLFNIGEQWAPVALMAAGMTFVLIGGGFDLSVGAIYAFAATLSASFAQHHSPAIAFLGSLAIGLGTGLLNGLLVTKVNINPLIATLGTAQIVRGFALIYSNGGTYTIQDSFFITLGSGYAGPVPVPFIIVVAIMIVLGLVLWRSSYGRSIYAIGGNSEASFLSGVPVDRIRASTYVISGACGALAGMLYVGRVGSGQANVGTGIELQVIAAALIGGVSILGGEGAVWRAAAGVALLAFLQNFFNQASVNDFWQSVVQGVIIIAAVALDSYSKRRHKKPLRIVFAELRDRFAYVRRRPPAEVLSAESAVPERQLDSARGEKATPTPLHKE